MMSDLKHTCRLCHGPEPCCLHRDLKSLALLVLRAGKIAVLESERHIFEFLISEDGADEGPQCQRCVSFNRDTLG